VVVHPRIAIIKEEEEIGPCKYIIIACNCDDVTAWNHP
jgi:hypothetical protein